MPKGGRLPGGSYNKDGSENAIRRRGKRPTAIDPGFLRLLDVIAETRGGTKAHHLQMAIALYATEEEVEKAGLIEE